MFSVYVYADRSVYGCVVRYRCGKLLMGMKYKGKVKRVVVLVNFLGFGSKMIV